VRGFADQHLRKKDDPLDSSYRRIALIVRYLNKEAGSDGKPKNEGAGPKGEAHATESSEKH